MRCGRGNPKKNGGCGRTLTHPSVKTKLTGICHACRTGKNTTNTRHKANRVKSSLKEFAVQW